MQKQQRLWVVLLAAIILLAGAKVFRDYHVFHEADTHYHYGDNLLSNGGSGAAIPEFEKSLSLYPEMRGSWMGLIECHLEMKNWDLAIATCDRALKYFPKAGDIYKERASAYRQKGDSAQEISDLEKAKQLSPDDPLVDKLLARAHKPRPASPTPQATQAKN